MSAVTGGAPGSIPQASSATATKEGFQFFHLMLVALISLLVGAIVSRQASDAAGPSDL